MPNQLFRPEAVDGYTERWLGEVTELSAIPRIFLAPLGLVMLTSLITVLTVGSYTRPATVKGFISGAKEQVVVAASSPSTIHVGQDLLLEVPGIGAESRHFTAQVTSVAPAPVSGRSSYRISVEIPVALRRHVGTRFLLHVPAERRHIYQWMLPCLSN